jgi:arsenate reductase
VDRENAPQEAEIGHNVLNVLFLCADNSICSIIAEALLRRWGGEYFRAFSAGIVPRGEIHPQAADFLHSIRAWHQGLHSKGLEELLDRNAPRMDFVISVGDRPPGGLPARWPGSPRLIHWRITEPVIHGGVLDPDSLKKISVELENRIRLFALVYQKELRRAEATAA